MKALVTGGAGFIGSNIVHLLVEAGHQVVVLDNLLSGYRCNLDPFPGVAFIEGDVRDAKALDEAVADVQVIFHLAASVGNKRSIEHPITDSEINVIGTLRVLEAAHRHGVRKVVYSSSAGIFGQLKTLPISENHPVEPDSPYAKLYPPLECICLRYFNVYGPNQRFDAYGNVIPIFVFRTLRGEPITIFGDGEQTRDFINVRDVVQANLKAAFAMGMSGAFNIGSGSRITINNLVERLRLAGSLNPTVTYGPPRAGDVRDSLADIGAAQRAFGFQPDIEISEGIKEYVTWARQEVAR